MMNLSNCQKDILDWYLSEEHLTSIVEDTSRIAWDHTIEKKDLNMWLDNFDGSYLESIERERKIALWLLAHFTFYTLDDVRILCNELFKQFIHIKVSEIKRDYIDICTAVNDILNNTLFIGLGNNSESGNNILYYFRQENKLPLSSFEVDSSKIYGNLVYIDDMTMSGNQAKEYINSSKLSAEHVYLGTLIATQEAIDNINQDSTIEKIIAVVSVDERERAFADDSHMFSDKKILEVKDVIKGFCEYYGKRASRKHRNSLGYKNGQYMLGFVHNTPNNTLPIFWETHNGWKPIFRRYPKIDSEREIIIDGNKYY